MKFHNMNELDKDTKLKLRITFWGSKPLPHFRRWFVGRNLLGKDDPTLGNKHVTFYRDTKDHSLYAEVEGQWYAAIVSYGTESA